MQAELVAGQWRVRGKTFDVKESLKALRGRFDGSKKEWVLPGSVDQEALIELGIEVDSPIWSNANAANAAFLGDTFPIKDKLKTLGAVWDPDKGSWLIKGSFNKQGLAEALTDLDIDWEWWNMETSDRIQVVVDYDQERHKYASLYCQCTARTCNVCRFACCRQARPYSPEQLDEKQWIGVIYECDYHGKTMVGHD